MLVTTNENSTPYTIKETLHDIVQAMHMLSNNYDEILEKLNTHVTVKTWRNTYKQLRAPVPKNRSDA